MHSTTPYIVSCFVRSNPTFFRWVSGRYGYSPYLDSHCNFTGKAATCWQPGLGTLEWRIFRSTYNQRLVNVWLDIVQAVEDWAESVANSGAVSYVPTLARPLQCSEGTSIHGYDGLQAFFAFVNQSRRRYGTVKRAIKKYITLDVCAIHESVYLGYDEDDEDEEATCHYKRMSAVMEDSLPYIYPEPKCRKVPSHA